MYEFTYETWTPEQVDAYLRRIGWDGAPARTRETLDELVYRHQCSIPFEDLDPFSKAPSVPLDGGALFDKLVLRRRGGFCFELNGGFVLLLRAIGFDAYSCMCRVALGGRTQLGALAHRAVLVRLDGKLYLCDVGLGGPMAPFAVEVSPQRQTRRGETYWIEPTCEGWYLERRLDEAGAEAPVILFAPQPFLPMDFEPLCRSLLANPACLFRTRRIVNLRTADGHRSILDNVLTICDAAGRRERRFEDAELPALLRTWFSMDPDA